MDKYFGQLKELVQNASLTESYRVGEVQRKRIRQILRGRESEENDSKRERERGRLCKGDFHKQA